jgi:hypothetical protein
VSSNLSLRNCRFPLRITRLWRSTCSPWLTRGLAAGATTSPLIEFLWDLEEISRVENFEDIFRLTLGDTQMRGSLKHCHRSEQWSC